MSSRRPLLSRCHGFVSGGWGIHHLLPRLPNKPAISARAAARRANPGWRQTAGRVHQTAARRRPFAGRGKQGCGLEAAPARAPRSHGAQGRRLRRSPAPASVSGPSAKSELDSRFQGPLRAFESRRGHQMRLRGGPGAPGCPWGPRTRAGEGRAHWRPGGGALAHAQAPQSRRRSGSWPRPAPLQAPPLSRPRPRLPSIPASLRRAERSHPAGSRSGTQGRGGALRSARRRPAPPWLAAPALAAPWLAAGREAGPPGRAGVGAGAPAGLAQRSGPRRSRAAAAAGAARRARPRAGLRARAGRAAPGREGGGGAEGRGPAHGPAGPGAPDASLRGPSPRCRPRPGRDDADGAATRRCQGSRPPGPRGLALTDWPSGRREAGAWGAGRAAPCRPRCGSRSWSSCSWTGPGATRAP